MKQTQATLTLSIVFLAASISFAAGKAKTQKVIKTETETTVTETTTTSAKAPAEKIIAGEDAVATLTVEGMHCGGCKNMITKSVCGDEALSSAFESCGFTDVDTKKQIGTMVIKYKKGVMVDLDQVEAAIKKAGDYKLTKREFQAKLAK